MSSFHTSYSFWFFKQQVHRGYNNASSSGGQTDGQIFWAGLKPFHCDFWSGFTIIYGENYAFLSLFTKALLTDGQMDQWMDGQMDTPSCRDARMHLKTTYVKPYASVIILVTWLCLHEKAITIWALEIIQRDIYHHHHQSTTEMPNEACASEKSIKVLYFWSWVNPLVIMELKFHLMAQPVGLFVLILSLVWTDGIKLQYPNCWCHWQCHLEALVPLLSVFICVHNFILGRWRKDLWCTLRVIHFMVLSSTISTSTATTIMIPTTTKIVAFGRPPCMMPNAQDCFWTFHFLFIVDMMMHPTASNSLTPPSVRRIKILKVIEDGSGMLELLGELEQFF